MKALHLDKLVSTATRPNTQGRSAAGEPIWVPGAKPEKKSSRKRRKNCQREIRDEFASR